MKICLTPTAKHQLKEASEFLRLLIVVILFTSVILSMTFNILVTLDPSPASFAHTTRGSTILVMSEIGFVLNIIALSYLLYKLLQWIVRAFEKC